jgi:hypothetical protein
MFELISSKIRGVEPEDAEVYLGYNHYQGQRFLREKHVKKLTTKIIKKLFTIGNITTAHCAWDKEERLVNGQHQLHAVLQAQLPIRVVVEEYKCKTADEFALLYRQFDGHALRSLGDLSRPEVVSLGLDWKPKAIAWIISSIGYIEGHQSGAVDREERVECIKRYKNEGNFLNDILSVGSSTETHHLRRGAVGAAMIVTYKKSHADAETFWEQVRDGDNLKNTETI